MAAGVAVGGCSVGAVVGGSSVEAVAITVPAVGARLDGVTAGIVLDSVEVLESTRACLEANP